MRRQSLDKSIEIKGRRKKTGAATIDFNPGVDPNEIIGASTSASRHVEFADGVCAFFHTVTGDDITGDGSRGNPYKTLDKAHADVPATKDAACQLNESTVNVVIINKALQADLGIIPSIENTNQYTYTNQAHTNSVNIITGVYGDQYVLCANADILTASNTDITAWTRNAAVFSGIPYSIAFRNRSTPVYIVSEGTARTWRATDPAGTWTDISSNIGADFAGCAISFFDAQGIFVGIGTSATGGNTKIIYSGDGLIWINAGALSQFNAMNSTINLFQLDEWFFVVLDDEAGGPTVAPHNGTAGNIVSIWRTKDVKTPPGWIEINLTGITANKSFTIVGGAGILMMFNGTGSRIYTSTDYGDNWTNAGPSPATSAKIIKIKYGNGLFWIFDIDGAVWSSPTGASWTSRNTTGFGTASAHRLSDIIYGGYYIFMGEDGSSRIEINAGGLVINRSLIGYDIKVNRVSVSMPNIASQGVFKNNSITQGTIDGQGGVQIFSGTIRNTNIDTSVLTAIVSDLNNRPLASITSLFDSLLISCKIFFTNNPGMNLNHVTTDETIVSTANYPSGGAGSITIQNVRSGKMKLTARIITFEGSLIINPSVIALIINGVPELANAISITKSTIIGAIEYNNLGETLGFSVWRGNIFEGNLIAEAIINLESGNIRGTTVTNVIIFPVVTSINPLFADAIDYQLRYEVNGFAFDSPLVGSSVFFINANSGLQRDIGAYDIDVSKITQTFQERFLLPKPVEPEDLIFERNNVANLQIGLDGTPDVFNDVRRQTEKLIIRYRTVDNETLKFIERQESQKDQQVAISVDPHLEVDFTASVTANGAHAIGVSVINITTTEDLSEVTRIGFGGKSYFVVYPIPLSGVTTKFVLDRISETALSGGETITITQPAVETGYQYIVPGKRQTFRANGVDDSQIGGIVLEFIRKVGS